MKLVRMAVAAMFCLVSVQLHAGYFADSAKATGPKENCGSPVEEPGLIGSILNSEKKTAAENYRACLQRNQEREYMQGKGELQAIVDRTRESCKQAIRRISKNPSTLAFDYGKDFDYLNGLNGSGVDTTDGGFSVKIRGSDVNGPFFVTCYMDKAFNVTNVR